MYKSYRKLCSIYRQKQCKSCVFKWNLGKNHAISSKNSVFLYLKFFVRWIFHCCFNMFHVKHDGIYFLFHVELYKFVIKSVNKTKEKLWRKVKINGFPETKWLKLHQRFFKPILAQSVKMTIFKSIFLAAKTGICPIGTMCYAVGAKYIVIIAWIVTWSVGDYKVF